MIVGRLSQQSYAFQPVATKLPPATIGRRSAERCSTRLWRWKHTLVAIIRSKNCRIQMAQSRPMAPGTDRGRTKEVRIEKAKRWVRHHFNLRERLCCRFAAGGGDVNQRRNCSL